MKKEIEKRILSTLILIPLSFFFIIKGNIFFNFFLFICFVLTLYEWHLMTSKKNYNILGYLFLCFSFYSAYTLRNDFDDGSLLIFFVVILTCIFTDIGGYIFGNIFKGPKLTKISPKKTYSGMIGGYLLSIIMMKVLFNFSYFIYEGDINFNKNFLIIIILISSISQIGDIVISYFKRKANVKDTGKIIPGHGGVMDRVDGMIFAFPFSYILLSLKLFVFFK